MTGLGMKHIAAVVSVAIPLCALDARAENYFGLQFGGMFGARGTNMTAMEDLNYTGSPPMRHPATGSDISLNSSLMFGFKAGRFLESMPGIGIEIEGMYSRPDFKRQNVTITLRDTSVGGHSAFTEDQLAADFHMLSSAVNILYRFQPVGGVMPYVGAGPAFHLLFIRGSGDSCHIVAPAALARGFCAGGDMVSKGQGFGFNAKAGIEVPLGERLSFDLEYKFNYGRMKVDWFRSFSDITVDYTAHGVAGGLRVKF